MKDPKRDILDGMAAPIFEHPSGSKGRYVVKPDGTVVPEITLPSAVEIYTPANMPPIIGSTRIGEYLMIDIRVAQLIPKGSKLFKICEKLSRAKACGVVESTLVIDLLDASAPERRFLLCPTNWPKPGGPDDSEVK